MAIIYPLAMPQYGAFASITLRASSVAALSASPFTLAHQVHEWPGQGWQADISLPQMSRVDAQKWAAWLVGLRGRVGTFLLGDPAVMKRGTAVAATVTGVSGSGSLAVTMTGTLLAGDHVQIGLGTGARLHQVLADQDGNGTLEVWPYLRRAVASEALVLVEPKGLFRLAQSSVEWTMQPANIAAGGAFSAMEVI